jgi:hypothetical protein
MIAHLTMQNGNLPSFVSQSQQWIVGGLIFLGVIALVIVRFLWRMREPLNAAIRDFMTTKEGQAFMEGVINGKVRREITDHNTSLDAHSAALKHKVDEADFNAAMALIRAQIETMNSRMANKGDEIIGKLDRIDERLRDEAKDRKG